MKLLIVDDELWSRRLIKKLLNWDEYGIKEIIEADNGSKAIDIIDTKTIDLLITDMRMPGVDGAMLLEHIHDNNIDLEVIVMSGYEDYKYLHAALKTKAIDYLLKPVVKEELHHAVMSGVHKITKKKSYSYIETILKRDDLKDEINAYYQLKIALLNHVVSGDENKIIQTTEELIKEFFTMSSNPQFTTFILRDLKQATLELETENDVSVKYDNSFGPETLKERFLHISSVIHEKKKTDTISVLDVQRYIDTHIGEPITLQDLADKYFVSKEHLSRLFKKEVSDSVQHYIIQKKVEYAKHLLRNYDVLAISTIAVMSGYTDIHYFYRVFKKVTGTTPAQYRKSISTLSN